ncbi:PAB-dependent poly(A)-specific ribonuclease subunit 3 [Rhizoclosmatium hyalinum]|nr:PAB-dependent poly(A)-specific ribonuclease subunit 3 [Rhizoclosmatium hyalinum]
MTSIEGWRRIKHAGVVSVREAFTTKAFGDNCEIPDLSSFGILLIDLALVFVYDYFPLSTTLSAMYFVPLRAGAKPGVPEKSLWSYIIQISSAIKTLHSSGLAARILEPSKLLVTGKNRVRLNCCGIFDMINYDGGKNVIQFQVSLSLALFPSKN